MMAARRQMIGLLVITLLAQDALWAVDERRLRWDELESAIARQRIAMVLPDGTAIEGTVDSVRPDGLVLDVTKTSNPAAQSKGRATIPAQSVSTLSVRKTRSRGRLIGTAVGAGAGVLLGWLVALLVTADEKTTTGSKVAFAGVTAGLATAGYFAGRESDRRPTVITIVSR